MQAYAIRLSPAVGVVCPLLMAGMPSRKIVVSTLLVLVMLSGVACKKLLALTDEAKPPVRSGSCWSDGESFTEVVDGDDNVHRVEPIQLRHLEAAEHVWLCGVLRTDVTPAQVQERYTLMDYLEDGHSLGFYMPSGEPVYIYPVDPSPKFWVLAPALWVLEGIQGRLRVIPVVSILCR